MGRQINFYMDKEKEDEFVKYAFEKDFYVIEENIPKKEKNIYKTFKDYKRESLSYELYFCKNINVSKIMFTKSGRIDYSSSPIIEFTKTFIYSNSNENIIKIGRIWYEYKYINNNNQFIIKDEQLLKDYYILVEWIRKNVPRRNFVYGGNLDSGGWIAKECITEKMIKINKTGKYIFL